MRTIEQILQTARTIAVVGLSNKPERASLEVGRPTCSRRATASCPSTRPMRASRSSAKPCTPACRKPPTRWRRTAARIDVVDVLPQSRRGAADRERRHRRARRLPVDAARRREPGRGRPGPRRRPRRGHEPLHEDRAPQAARALAGMKLRERFRAPARTSSCATKTPATTPLRDEGTARQQERRQGARARADGRA